MARVLTHLGTALFSASAAGGLARSGDGAPFVVMCLVAIGMFAFGAIMEESK